MKARALEGIRRCLGAVMLAGALSAAHAEVRLASIFGDHMVLQRETLLRIWGLGAPGETVTVNLHRQSQTTVTDTAGHWIVHLAAEPAGGPHELTVHGRSNSIRLQDVLIGEVWLAAGQSNMAWLLQDAQDGLAEVAAADDPLLRHIKIGHRTALQPLEDVEPSPWQTSRAGTAGQFSAVAYHFARRLRQELKVPVGLVNVSWGGTMIETWMSREAMAEHEDMRVLVAKVPASATEFSARHRERMQALIARWQGSMSTAENPQAWADPAYGDAGWRTLQVPGPWEQQGLAGFDGVLWYRRSVTLSAAQLDNGPSAELHLAMVDDCDETFVNGQKVGGLCGWNTPRHYTLPAGLLHEGINLIAVRVNDLGGDGGIHGETTAPRLQLGSESLPLAGLWRSRIEAPLKKLVPEVNDLPSLLFNGMLNPLVGFGLRGAIWYQGESNVERASQYERSFGVFLADVRRRWGLGDFPFYSVQLAAYQPLQQNSLDGSQWAELREAQRRSLILPNTGMVVATDLGDADDIHPRNKRPVGERLARLALHNDYGGRELGRGPTLRRVRVVGHRIELDFGSADGRLIALGGPLKGFTIADASQRFRPAEAHIEGQRVIVSSTAVKQPRAVRFGWVDNPRESNLFNRAGLPASPFRTDNWPLLTRSARYSF